MAGAARKDHRGCKARKATPEVAAAAALALTVLTAALVRRGHKDRKVTPAAHKDLKVHKAQTGSSAKTVLMV